MKISYLTFFSFILILLLFSITTYINYLQSKQVEENSAWVSESATVIRHSNRFQRNILNMISGLRGYLFTGENYFIQAYDSARQENETILKELSQLVSDNDIQKRALEEINRLNNQWIEEFALPLINAKKIAASSDSSQLSFNRLYREKLIEGSEQALNRRLQLKFRDFSNYEYDIRDARQNVLAESIHRTSNISFYLTILSIVLGSCIAIFLARRISIRILRMVKMANEISGGNYEVYIPDSGKDELSGLARALNNMAKVLSENISLLKRTNEELNQFAYIVSHDLKAPLRGIDNVITWIEEDHSHEITPKVSTYIQLIKGRIVRAENLIRGILSYARASNEVLEKEEVDVNQLLTEIKENLAPSPGLKFIFQAGLPVFYAEKLPLQQIFTNLLSNAVKYHDKPDGEIRVYYKDRQTHFEFFVEDNGPGIAKNYHQKIFMIFQTLQERDIFESTGIGLAIVKKMLDARNQKITISSEPGKGSVFSFTWQK